MKPHFILAVAIAAIYSPLLSANSIPSRATPSTPVPAYGDDDPLNPAEVQDFASKDTNRIRGNIQKALVRKAPYVDTLDGGTLEAGLSDTVRSIIAERAVLNQSLVRPVFTADTAMCGKTGESAEVGSTEYSYELQTLRGMGPLVCIKGMRNAFMGSYSTAEDALRKQIIQLVSADVRSTLVDRSGLKLVVKSGTDFDAMFTGDSQEIDTNFENMSTFVPDAAINFSLLEYLSQFMRENLLVEGFEGPQGEPILKFIGSQEIITKLRDEANIRDDHRYIAAGSYAYGEKSLTRYTWEGPYRGYGFGIDPQPLRFSTVDADGQPVFIEPEIARNANNKGKAARINPLWARARYEIALVMGANSFKRLTPEDYSGEGSFRFPAQANMGQLKFKVIEDNNDNVWADFGRHFYQISRAYQPVRPHAVCAIAFKRRPVDFQLTAISGSTNYSNANSL